MPAKSQSTTQEYVVNDLKIIVKKVPRDIISVIFIVKGGTSNYDKSTEGIELLALNWAVEGGTINFPKTLLNQKLESLGTKVDFYAGYDYSLIEMTCLKSTWMESWDILSDILINPTFENDQFQLVKKQLISDAKYNNQSPNTKLQYLAMANAFNGMNYEKVPDGTTKSLAGLTSGQVRKYYEKTIGRKNCFVTIVGDLDAETVKTQVVEKLQKLPAGKDPSIFDTFEIEMGPAQIHDRNLETNYLRGYMNAPRLESEEGLSMMIAMEMLNQRVFDIVRVEAGLSYNPRAFFANAVVNTPYNVLYASTSKPKDVISKMVEILDSVRKHGFTNEELESQKATYLTNFYLGQETTSSQCNEIVMNELRAGWQNSPMTLENLAQVDINSINSVIRKYSDVIRWTYLGNKDEVTASDFAQPE